MGRARVLFDEVLPRPRHVLRERAGPVDAENRDVLAHVRVPGPALIARAAGDVSLPPPVVPLLRPRARGSDLHDLPRPLVPLDAGGLDPLLGPRVPLVDVHVP